MIRKEFLLLTLLFTANMQAYSKDLFTNFLQRLCCWFHEIDTSFASTANSGVGQGNTPAPAPRSSATQMFDYQELYAYLTSQLQKKGKELYRECPKSGYTSSVCVQHYYDHNILLNQLDRARKGILTQQEIHDIRMQIINTIKHYSSIINASHEHASQLERSSYVNGIYLEGRPSLRSQRKQILDDLAELRGWLKSIFYQLI